MTDTRRFDEAAASWDEEPWRVLLAREISDAIIAAAQPTPAMDAMDFGCGTGLITLFLHPHLRSITGVDSSPGMIDVLAGKIRALGLANVRTQLCDVERGERPAGRYHLIVSSMTLHHLAEQAPLFRLFADLLLPGGILCLADLDKEDGSFHDDMTGVHHLGFERPPVRGLLADAGFTDCRDTTASVIRKETGDFPVFLISARKPA
ncbi:MAG TPA: class I SAM-dependent methyltransferase [Geobacteraceae bacterium]